MKKIVSAALAAVTIAGGSVAVAAVSPFGVASAQTDATTTTQSPTTTAPATTAPAGGTAKPAHTGVLDEALTALVTDGTLTQAQSDAVKAKVDSRRPAPGTATHKSRGGIERGMRIGRGGAVLDEAATYLGTTAHALRTQLEGGATLASIAGDKTQGLIDSLVASANTRIDAAVTAGTFDATKAATLKTDTATRITNEVNGVKPAGKAGDDMRGHGHGHRNGAASTAPSATAPSIAPAAPTTTK
jgi:hypothetical protein